MPATAYLANLIASALAHGSPFQGPAHVNLALVISEPTPTVAGTEVTLGGYVRVAYAQSDWANDAAGNLTNTSLIAYPAATADYDAEVLAVEAYDDAGNRLWYQDLSTPQVILAGMTPEWLPGDLVLEVV
jgi:hypothetical protein